MNSHLVYSEAGSRSYMNQYTEGPGEHNLYRINYCYDVEHSYDFFLAL